MILSAQSINARNRQSGLISPFYLEGKSHGMSFGLSQCGYDIRIRESMVIMPGQFRLASSVEKFWIPDDLLMRIVDKSTWARQGLCVQNTVAEPGWHGYLTLELTNHSKLAIALEQEMPIAQVIFEQLDEPTERPYNGKYQDAPVGATKAILES